MRILFTKLILVLVLCAASQLQAQRVMISGIIDATLPGGLPKAVELYFLEDVSDLSEISIRKYANGSSTPTTASALSGSANAGDYYYINGSSDPASFISWFGFSPDTYDSAVNNNGDDVVELLEHGVIIDVYGEPGVDGTGETWEYLDGWGYSNANRCPSAVFNPSDWYYSGKNALDGQTSNATATTPFPTATLTTTCTAPSNDVCSNATALATDFDGALTGEVLTNATIDLTSSCSGNVPGVWYNVNTDADGGDLVITVTPDANTDVEISVYSDCAGTFIQCVDTGGAGDVEMITITDPTSAQGGGSSSRFADTDYKILVADASDRPTKGTFDITAGGTALPVEMGKFGAKVFSNNVNLSWVTYSEINNEAFVIEHSADGVSFVGLAKVEGAGTSSDIVEYNYAHTNILTATNYYRLKQVDFDGSSSYSNVISVELDRVANLRPSSTVVTSEITMLDGDQYALDVKVVSTTGSVVKSLTTETNTAFDLSDLSNGVYYIVTGGQTFRFVKM